MQITNHYNRVVVFNMKIPCIKLMSCIWSPSFIQPGIEMSTVDSYHTSVSIGNRNKDCIGPSIPVNGRNKHPGN